MKGVDVVTADGRDVKKRTSSIEVAVRDFDNIADVQKQWVEKAINDVETSGKEGRIVMPAAASLAVTEESTLHRWHPFIVTALARMIDELNALSMLQSQHLSLEQHKAQTVSVLDRLLSHLHSHSPRRDCWLHIHTYERIIAAIRKHHLQHYIEPFIRICVM